jgi:HSP20 family protein
MKPITFTPWNQLQQLQVLQHGLGGLLARTAPSWPEGQDEPLAVAEWAPVVDISEDDKEYTIKAELPEVKKEDVRVTAEGGTLTITGERRAAKVEKTRKYHRVERAYGGFERNFSLPEDTSAGSVTAELKEGVLTVRLAKAEKPKAQQIEIQVL